MPTGRAPTPQKDQQDPQHWPAGDADEPPQLPATQAGSGSRPVAQPQPPQRSFFSEWQTVGYLCFYNAFCLFMYWESETLNVTSTVVRVWCVISDLFVVVASAVEHHMLVTSETVKYAVHSRLQPGAHCSVCRGAKRWRCVKNGLAVLLFITANRVSD